MKTFESVERWHWDESARLAKIAHALYCENISIPCYLYAGPAPARGMFVIRDNGYVTPGAELITPAQIPRGATVEQNTRWIHDMSVRAPIVPHEMAVR